MRFVASGPRQSPPRPTSAAPRPLAQLSNPPPSSASVSSTPQPRPRHPHARSSTRDCVTSDSRRSLGSRAGVRRQQWASATRSTSPWRSRTRRIWPRFRYNPQNTDPFLSFRFRLSLAHADSRTDLPGASIPTSLSPPLQGLVPYVIPTSSARPPSSSSFSVVPST
ncbi:hypothetical protein C8R46DRAFT_1058384 [Mycena filopes]|nr:hypothetical protein C8R46DRAFT_1058384 [Mycena filopes]